jgi:pimeloyl-ACP methyl ester carboxylesterase
MERAELYVWAPETTIRAVMVFCPGHNGSGEGFASSREWQGFAGENGLALCGLSFASPMPVTKDGRGYSYAERGSGALLLQALKDEFHGTEYPLLLYGYSAGARFTASLLAWQPQRVAAWCASGVGNWPLMPRIARPSAGIVACGEYDAACYWSSLHYFQSGRQLGFPWCWVSLKGLGHDCSVVLDRFVRSYFAFRIKPDNQAGGSSEAGIYYDIATKRHLDFTMADDSPIFAAWLPANQDLVDQWLQIHHP